MSQYEIIARNKFSATDLEKGWVIDGGASIHMTSFKNDRTNIQPTYKLIYLAGGSSVLCKCMVNILIPITKNKKVLGSLILEDVFIAPNLDRWLQSNALVVKYNHNQIPKEFVTPPVSPQPTEMIRKKMRIDIGLLHSRLHRQNGVSAITGAHDLWRDAGITQSIDPLYTTYKIILIPVHSRGKIRESRIQNP